MGFISDTQAQITAIIDNAVANNAAALAQAIAPVFIAAIGLYVAIKIFQISFAPSSDLIMKEIVVTVVQLSAVSAFTYSAPYYSQYVIPFVMNSGQELSNAINGSSDAATSVDATWQAISTTMETFWEAASAQNGTFELGAWFKTGIIYVIGYGGGFILAFYSCIFLCVAQFAVGLLLSVGIIFICFSVFSNTRAMFTAWCGSCLNYILLNVFFSISLSFVTTYINSLTKNYSAENISLYMALTLLAIILVSVFMVEQIGTLCSSLTGGVGINGLTAAANGVGGKLLGGAARASGLRPFLQGFSGKMGSAARNAGESTASRIQQMASRGQKIKGG